MINLEIKDIPDYKKMKLLVISGEMDSAESNIISKNVEECIKQGYFYFIGDLRGVTYINSSGILDLLCCKQRLKQCGGGLKIFGLSNNIYTVMNAIGLTKMVSIYNTIDECLQSFSYVFKEKED